MATLSVSAFAQTTLTVPGQGAGTLAGFFREGTAVTLYATGTAELSNQNGSYQTFADGRISFVSGPETGAYQFFQTCTDPIGVAPAAGGLKFPACLGFLAESVTSPYGMLLGAWTNDPSTPPGYLSPAWFPVGTSSTVIAPAGGGYLFLVVNDIGQPAGDNAGGYAVTVSTTNGTALSVSANIGDPTPACSAQPVTVTITVTSNGSTAPALLYVSTDGINFTSAGTITQWTASGRTKTATGSIQVTVPLFTSIEVRAVQRGSNGVATKSASGEVLVAPTCPSPF